MGPADAPAPVPVGKAPVNQDDEHLRLLTIFHYVLAGFGALISCLPLVHLVVGILLVVGKLDGSKPPPPELGWVFIGIATFCILCGWTFSAGLAYSGRCLARRRKYTFCVVMAAIISVLCSPFGTILGVFTLIVLLRPGVKALFDRPAAPRA